MKNQHNFVLFKVGSQIIAISLNHIYRIEQIAMIQPLIGSPSYVLGCINYHNIFLPVINLRNLFNIPPKEIEVQDFLLITNSSSNKMAIWIDQIIDITPLSIDYSEITNKMFINNQYVNGISKLKNEIVIIHDFKEFLRSNDPELQKLHAQIEKGNEIEITD